MARLNWRKQPDERGLAKICQSDRGFQLRYDGKTLAHVAKREDGDFYFYGCGLNSLSGNKTYISSDDAKIACKNWVLSSDEYKLLTRRDTSKLT